MQGIDDHSRALRLDINAPARSVARAVVPSSASVVRWQKQPREAGEEPEDISEVGLQHHSCSHLPGMADMAGGGGTFCEAFVDGHLGSECCKE